MNGFVFEPVAYTHETGALARLGGFVAINTTIEIDRMGQCKAESIGVRQGSGAGGLVEGLRGSRSSLRRRG
jgi:acyl-CoA hydrolase